MIDNTSLILIAPEIFITIMSCVVLLSGTYFAKYQSSLVHWLTIVTLIVVSIITFYTIPVVNKSIFYDSFIVDKFACQLKLVTYLLLASIYMYARKYVLQRNFAVCEFYSLGLLSLLGMMLVISCGNYLTLYLGLELLVLPLYAMIVFLKNRDKYIEAAMKYFIIGSLGAGLLLFGISLIFGATGTINFTDIVAEQALMPVFKLGMVFIIVGIGLEFGAVPFHMWLPDIYEGSPTVVTMIVSTVPKIAIFALTYRLLTIAFTDISIYCQQLFILMALISIVVGNILAIAQPNLKRMLAYSTISHVGFILLGLFAAPQEGYMATIFYTIVYAFMVLAAFAVIVRLSSDGFESDNLSDLQGLSKREPWLAFIMLLTMLSLAGVPPLLGFYAKFLILQAVVNAGYAWVAAVSLFFTVIGAFYYLRVIRVMYFDDANQKNNLSEFNSVKNSMGISATVLLAAHGVSLLLLGIFPASILYYCLVMLS